MRSLIGKSLPALRGNVVTQLKSGAQADLLAGDTGSQLDPALAEWQVGTGRVVAWTPGLDSDWAAEWLGQTQLWNDAVRWTERGVAPSPLTPEALGSSGSLQIDLAGAGGQALGVRAVEGTLTDSRGLVRPISFLPVGPSLYDADVASLPAGLYRFALRTVGAVLHAATGELAIAYPAEYSPVSVHVSPMAQLVAQAGGRIIPAGELGALGGSEHSLWRLLALLALVVFLVGVTGRMLSGSGAGRRSPRAG